MLDNDENEQLSKDFNSCSVVDEEADVYNFVSNLADMFMGAVQYNNEISPNVSDICKVMTNTSHSPYDNLLRLLGDFKGIFLGDSENCTDNSWSSMIKELRNVTLGDEGGVGDRQWVYQTCSQFGYYQTCDKGTPCIFSHHMTLDKSLRICSEVFAISADDVFKRVQFTNSYYGSDQPRGTRIVFVNGSTDPWHALSVLKDIGDSETAIYIPGTSHCANMGSDNPNDPPQLKEAKKMIQTQIGKWLKEAQE